MKAPLIWTQSTQWSWKWQASSMKGDSCKVSPRDEGEVGWYAWSEQNTVSLLHAMRFMPLQTEIQQQLCNENLHLLLSKASACQTIETQRGSQTTPRCN